MTSFAYSTIGGKVMIKTNIIKTKISKTGIRFLVLLCLILMAAGPAATLVSAYVGVPTFSNRK